MDHEPWYQLRTRILQEETFLDDEGKPDETKPLQYFVKDFNFGLYFDWSLLLYPLHVLATNRMAASEELSVLRTTSTGKLPLPNLV